MTAGFVLPFVTEADPDRVGEGSLDPLGLRRIADPLADQLAPEVTARMSRIRFLTAIAACSHLVEEPAELMGPDGTPAYLAFEWHVVEAFVRKNPGSGTVGVPGIEKARARLRDRRRHLDAGSYLQTPKVFGFHGVYKRLAKDLGLVDDDLVLLSRGESLIEGWSREQGLDGFAQKRRHTPGGKLAERLESEVGRSLDKGVVQLGPTSGRWQTISRVFAPGGAGRGERGLLWDWLTDERQPVRRELARLIGREPDAEATERETLEQLLLSPLSHGLRERLDAIGAFEAAVRPIEHAFRLLRSITTQRTPSPVSPADVATNPQLRALSEDIPRAFEAAIAPLEAVGLATEFQLALGSLVEDMSVDQRVEALLDRHDQVQADKGKRSWFDRDERGFAVRGIGRLHDFVEERTDYLHPYRLIALRSFARDLRLTGAQ